MMVILRSRCAQVLGVTCCLFGIVSCATSVPLTPQRIDRVPAGRYHVTVSEDRTGIHKYNALLFETATAAVTLDVPTAEPGGVAGPDDGSAGSSIVSPRRILPASRSRGSPSKSPRLNALEHLRDAIRTLDAPPAPKEETGSTRQEAGAGA